MKMKEEPLKRQLWIRRDFSGVDFALEYSLFLLCHHLRFSLACLENSL